MEPDTIAVREFYTSGYQPPKYAMRTVQTLLVSIPEKYVQGIDCVVLTNQSGQPRRTRLGKVTSRKRRFPQSLVVGRYHPARQGGLAWIELFVDKLAGELAEYSWFPFLRQAVFGHVLFHEVGHHIHATVKPEYQEKEDVADNWGRKLMLNFVRKHYWYLWPFRKALGQALRAFSRTL